MVEACPIMGPSSGGKGHRTPLLSYVLSEQECPMPLCGQGKQSSANEQCRHIWGLLACLGRLPIRGDPKPRHALSYMGQLLVYG